MCQEVSKKVIKWVITPIFPHLKDRWHNPFIPTIDPSTSEQPRGFVLGNQGWKKAPLTSRGWWLTGESLGCHLDFGTANPDTTKLFGCAVETVASPGGRTGGRERHYFSGEGMKFEPGLYLPLKKNRKIGWTARGKFERYESNDIVISKKDPNLNLLFKFLFKKSFRIHEWCSRFGDIHFVFFDDMFFFLWWSSWGFLNIFKNYIPEN